MNLEDYYQTDTHWRQENLDKVIKEMSKTIGFNYEKIFYNKNIYNKFYGVYNGESALNRQPETLIYLTDETLDSVEVKYLENPKLNHIYSQEKLESMDSYEVYLDGASAFIEIYNENNKCLIYLLIYIYTFGTIPMYKSFLIS